MHTPLILSAATPPEVDVPIAGEIRSFAFTPPPAGWLPCDGASLLRATYPALFAAVGVTWGSADGAHFNAPDLRGRSPMGSGAGPGLTVRVLGTTDGEEGHVLTLAETASHDHFLVDPGHNHGLRGRGGDAVPGSQSIQGSANAEDGSLVDATVGAPTGATVSLAGGSTAHNTVHPVAVVSYGIFAG